MATDKCLLAPRPPACPPARSLYVGAALRDMPRNAVNTLLDRRIAVPVSVSIFGHEMTQSGLAEGGTTEVFQRRKQDSLARKVKLSSDADPRSQLFTAAAASLWPSRGKVGSVLSFFLSVCLSNDEICLFLPSRTRILLNKQSDCPCPSASVLPSDAHSRNGGFGGGGGSNGGSFLLRPLLLLPYFNCPTLPGTRACATASERASECGGRSRRAACEKPDRPLWSLDGGRVDQACLLCSRVHGALRLGNKMTCGWTKPRPQLVTSSVDRAHRGKRGWRDGRRIGAAARPPKLKESERSDGYGDKSEWRERRRRNETAPRPFSHNADSQPHNVLNKIALWSSMLEQFLSRCLQQTTCMIYKIVCSDIILRRWSRMNFTYCW